MKATGLVLDVASQRGGAEPGTVTLLDASPKRNHGAMTDVTWAQLPNGLRVMNFAVADNRVAVPYDLSITNFFAGITIEAWLATTQATGWLVSKGTSPYDYELFINNGRIRFNVNNGGMNIYPATPTGLNDGRYHYFVGTYDYSNGYAYVDGVEAGTAAYAVALATSATGLYLGNRSNLTVDYVGTLGLVRISNFSLTPAQVRSRFAATRSLFGV